MSAIVIIAITLAQVLALFLASTVAFDVIHVLLHRFAGSRSVWLCALGELHVRHHRFVDHNLDVHEEYTADNLRWHVIPEFLTQSALSLCLLWLVSREVVLGAMAIQTLVFLLILHARGRDLNHRPITSLRASRPSWFCLPAYHALHHAYPKTHFSSWIKLLDYALQTGVACAGRRVALAMPPNAFTAALVEELAARGVTEIAACELPTDVEASQHLVASLRVLDILVLDAYALGGGAVAWIECFARAAAGRKLPPEVWVLSLETAAAESAVQGRASIQSTYQYWTDARMIYRYIDLPECILRDAVAARRAAHRTMRLIRRGCHYIPARGFGAGVLGFLRFRLAVLRATIWRRFPFGAAHCNSGPW
jgi:monoglucosyldiacylglycerol epimerase